MRIYSHNAMLVLAKKGSRIGKCCSGKSFWHQIEQDPKEPNRGQMLMCANIDKAIKYYQDATLGNATQKGYCNQF